MSSCDSGPSAVIDNARPGHPLLVDIAAVVFDLDDTLTDTFGRLIVPLEHEAAIRMAATGFGGDRGDQPTELAQLLLQVRQRAPTQVESRLRELDPLAAPRAIEARRAVFRDFDIKPLTLLPGVRQLLSDLQPHYGLFLLTEGNPHIQMAKIAQLDLTRFMRRVCLVPPGTEKSQALRTLLETERVLPRQVLVVGNRLDREIAAGIALGAATVWVRHGEGSLLVPSALVRGADVIVDNVLEIRPLLLAEARVKTECGPPQRL